MINHWRVTQTVNLIHKIQKQKRNWLDVLDTQMKQERNNVKWEIDQNSGIQMKMIASSPVSLTQQPLETSTTSVRPLISFAT